MRYLRRTLRVPFRSLDPVSGELWARGTLGLEVQEDEIAGFHRVEAYFSTAAAPLDPGSTVWSRLAVELLAEEEVPDRDWLAGYRKRSRPFPVGRGFEVDPREPREIAPSAPGRRRLALPAGRAFGTGSHATTQMMVEGLERQQPICGSVLDVGTGSGILSFVALALGARAVVGLDTELEAVFVARRNGRRNPPSPTFLAGGVEALLPVSSFELVLVNVLPQHILEDLAKVARLVSPRGTLLLSGLLWSQREEMLGRLTPLGLSCDRQERRQEWAVLELRRGPE